jgi:hypothetical protein
MSEATKTRPSRETELRMAENQGFSQAPVTIDLYNEVVKGYRNDVTNNTTKHTIESRFNDAVDRTAADDLENERISASGLITARTTQPKPVATSPSNECMPSVWKLAIASGRANPDETDLIKNIHRK